MTRSEKAEKECINIRNMHLAFIRRKLPQRVVCVIMNAKREEKGWNLDMLKISLKAARMNANLALIEQDIKEVIVNMQIQDLYALLSENAYPGRGIMIGRSGDGKKGVIAYFIMGRSGNSRNRIFVEEAGGIRTEAFDPSKMEDPSLIIYSPVRVRGNCTIVTNGDQTDTIYEGLDKGFTFEQALGAREFEPDAPNYTPRISGIVETGSGDMKFKLSILRSADGNPVSCERFTFSYSPAMAGEGRFISTYREDGNPLPSFDGVPLRIAVDGEIDELTEKLWSSLNEENKVSLFVRYIDLEDGSMETRIVNKNV